MAATVGELVVNLKARTGAFSKGMQDSARRTSQFGQAAKAAAAKVAVLVGAAAAVRISFQALRWVGEGINIVDRMAKVSSKLGILVDELDGLRFAAARAGIASNTLDMALQRMTRRVAEAAIGTGEAKAAIKELGLDARKLAAVGPYQSMLKIADAMEAIESPAHRVRLAFKLFDSEGAELVNMLSKGSAELEKFKARMESVSSLNLAGSLAIEQTKDLALDVGSIFQSIQKRAGQGWGMMVATRGFRSDWSQQFGMDVLSKYLGQQKARRNAIEMQQAIAAEKAAHAGRGILGTMATDLALSGVSDAQKRIVLWQKEALAVGMAKWEVEAYGIAMRKLARAQEEWTAKDKAARDALQQRGQEIAAQMNLAKQLIGQQIRGGDGTSLQLSAADQPGSAGAYSAIARRGLGLGAKKTDEEILRIVKQQLESDRKSEQHLQELLAKLDFGLEEVEIR